VSFNIFNLYLISKELYLDGPMSSFHELRYKANI
jgi:hypothetical protein